MKADEDDGGDQREQRHDKNLDVVRLQQLCVVSKEIHESGHEDRHYELNAQKDQGIGNGFIHAILLLMCSVGFVVQVSRLVPSEE